MDGCPLVHQARHSRQDLFALLVVRRPFPCGHGRGGEPAAAAPLETKAAESETPTLATNTAGIPVHEPAEIAPEAEKSSAPQSAIEDYHSSQEEETQKALLIAQAQESNRDVCDETATVTGFGDYDLNGSVNLCYADGSGFYEFAWDGGCTLMTLSYSGGDLDASGYGFTTGLFFFGFEEKVNLF